MRLILPMVVALSSLLAFPALAAQNETVCTSQAEIIQAVKGDDPSVTFAIYKGEDADAIQAGMAQIGVVLEGNREFIVFSNGSDVDFLVGVKDGCYEGSAKVPHRFIDKWLGEGA